MQWSNTKTEPYSHSPGSRLRGANCRTDTCCCDGRADERRTRYIIALPCGMYHSRNDLNQWLVTCSTLGRNILDTWIEFRIDSFENRVRENSFFLRLLVYTYMYVQAFTSFNFKKSFFFYKYFICQCIDMYSLKMYQFFTYLKLY